MRRTAVILGLIFLAALFQGGGAVAQNSGPTDAVDLADCIARQVVSACKRLALNGNIAEQLGFAYRSYFGKGVPQDYVEAMKWYRMAADEGIALAQGMVADMYVNGQGVGQDYGEAMRWYRKAADQGDSGAQNDLGVMYYDGKGVPQDYVLAHMWFNLAAAHGEPLGVKNRALVASKMTPEQIAEAQKLAREWKPTSGQ